MLDRSFTRSPGQSQSAVIAAQQARALQEDLFKVQYELDDLQHKYGGLEKSYNDLSKFSSSFILFLNSIFFLRGKKS